MTAEGKSGGGVFGVLNEIVAPPGWWLVVATGLFAALASAATVVLMLVPRRLLITRVNVLGTVIHEGGHALVSIVTGGGVFQVVIASADSGSARTWSPSPLSRTLTLVAGYAAPPLAGLGFAALLHRGLAPAVLALTTLAMALLLLVTRDLLTAGVLVILGVLAFSALTWAPGWLQNIVGYAEAWLLLTSEIGGLAALVVNRLRSRSPGTDDAARLAETTPVPAFAWIAAWAALIGWAVWTAAPLLWP